MNAALHRRIHIGAWRQATWALLAVAVVGLPTPNTGSVTAVPSRDVAATAPDWLDHSFADGLKTLDLSPGKDIPVGIAVQGDGKIVLLVNVDAQTDQRTTSVLRFLPDGGVDAGFGTNGRFILESTSPVTPLGLAIQPDGRIVLAGTTYWNGTTYPLVARVDGTGRLDPTFVAAHGVSAGFAHQSFAAMALTPDGKIVVAGSVAKDQVTAPLVVRFDSNGALDQSYGKGGFATRQFRSDHGSWRETATAVAVRPNGAVIVGGVQGDYVNDPSSPTGPKVSQNFMLTQFTPAGIPDTAFGAGGSVYNDLSRRTAVRRSSLSAIALQPDGRIVATGAAGGGVAVVRYLVDGQLDPGFGAAGLVISTAPAATRNGGGSLGSSTASAVAVDGSGRILVGGGATGYRTTDLAFARYTPFGALDRSFGRSGWARIDGPAEIEGILALAIQADGRTVFAGSSDWEKVTLLGRLPAPSGTTAITAWGWNGLGQLGDDSTTQRNAPVLVPGTTTVAVPAAGLYHALSLQGDGTVSAWGWNGAGQLGNGSTTDRDTPQTVPGLANVTSTAAGAHHSLAVSGGRVYGWGWNASGQLGDGTLVNRTVPTLVSGLTDVVEVSAGMYHSLARLSDGTVWAWGSNFVGQLGDGTLTDRRQPVQVLTLSKASAISAGGLHSLATAWKDDWPSVYGWGWNAQQQLSQLVGGVVTTPWPVWGFGQPAAISAGGFHSAVLIDDGSLFTWGWNASGQLGKGTTSPTGSHQVTSLPDATSISAGTAHTLATDSSGRVWGWGWNLFGQVGDGTTTDRSSPTLAQATTGAEVISAGATHSMTSTRSG